LLITISGLAGSGTTAVSRGPYCFAACTSDAAHTIPRQPDSSAACTRFCRMCAGAWSSLVRIVTASGIGVGKPALAAPARKPSTPALSIAAPPCAWKFRYVAPSAPITRAALFTVVGMSWS
jgi:hypothetical protein